MSILIKGLNMPRCCYECPCFYDSLYCGVTYKDFDEDNYRTDKYRQPDCPLVEIPTPHGRLVDADDIKAKCINEVFESMGTVAITDPSFDDEWADDICDVPTRLEAEK